MSIVGNHPSLIDRDGRLIFGNGVIRIDEGTADSRESPQPPEIVVVRKAMHGMEGTDVRISIARDGERILLHHPAELADPMFADGNPVSDRLHARKAISEAPLPACERP